MKMVPSATARTSSRIPNRPCDPALASGPLRGGIFKAENGGPVMSRMSSAA